MGFHKTHVGQKYLRFMYFPRSNNENNSISSPVYFFFLLTRKFNEKNKTTEKYNENPIADLEISLEKTFLVLDLYVIENVL